MQFPSTAITFHVPCPVLESAPAHHRSQALNSPSRERERIDWKRSVK